MSFKLWSSRYLVLKKGKLVEFHFTISETIIPTLSEKPVKTLGKLFYCSRCNSQNLHWLWSLAYQYWQVWVAWSFQGLDIPACHSAQGFVQKALVGTVGDRPDRQQGDPAWATLQAGLQNRPKLICKTKGKDRQNCGKHCAFYSLIYFSSFFKCKMIYNNVRKKKKKHTKHTLNALKSGSSCIFVSENCFKPACLEKYLLAAQTLLAIARLHHSHFAY